MAIGGHARPTLLSASGIVYMKGSIKTRCLSERKFILVKLFSFHFQANKISKKTRADKFPGYINRQNVAFVDVLFFHLSVLIYNDFKQHLHSKPFKNIKKIFTPLYLKLDPRW